MAESSNPVGEPGGEPGPVRQAAPGYLKGFSALGVHDVMQRIKQTPHRTERPPGARRPLPGQVAVWRWKSSGTG